jgi:hypothetical protein
VLLFVFRDRTKTPLEKLIETWEADLGRMWDAIAKPPQVCTQELQEGGHASIRQVALNML